MNIQSIASFPKKATPLLQVFLTVAMLAGCGSGSTASNAGSVTHQAAGSMSQQVDQVQAASSVSQPVNEVQSAADGARKPCDYMTQADAEKAVGQPLPKTRQDIAAGECDHTLVDFSAGASFRVDAWEAIKYGATVGPQQAVPVSGLGDEALNLSGVSLGSTLFVRKGNRGFLLSMHGPSIDDLPDRGLERKKTLASKILLNF